MPKVDLIDPAGGLGVANDPVRDSTASSGVSNDMADEFALALLNRTNPERGDLSDAEIVDVPIAPEVASAARPKLDWYHPDEVRKRSAGKSVVFLSAYGAGRYHGEYSPGLSKTEAKQAADAFYQGVREGSKDPGYAISYEWDREITSEGLKEAPGPETPTERTATTMDGKGGRDSKFAVIALGGAALLGIVAAAFSARSSGKKTAAKVPQPPASPPVPTGFVPPAAPPVTQPPHSAPPARTSPAEPQPEYTPTPTNRPVSSPPIVFNPTVLFDFGADDFNQNRNTGIVPPDDTGVAVTRLITFGPGEYDSATGILNRTNRTLSSGELQRLEAAGLNVPPRSGSGSTGYLQPGDALVPDLTPEQYSTMWLESYNAGYKYGARLKKADAANKVVSLAHIDGQRAGFLGLAPSPPAAEPGRTEYLQGYELGKVTDKEAGGAALVKAEASAWGSWDAVRGVPARSGPPAHHVSAANA